MVPIPLHWLMPVALCMAASASAAPATPPTARKPDPLDASTPVPAVAYAPTLGRDKRTAGDTPMAWRDANDTAARIGGWRVYAREAQQPEPPPAIPPDPKATTPPSHGGHKHP